jgi:hypothetical protein
MSQQVEEAEEMAREFEAANAEAIAFVEGCRPGQWTTMVPGEDWPVGVVLHHIATGHEQMTDWLTRARAGRAITITAADIDDANATHAGGAAEFTPAVTIDDLRRHGAVLALLLRSLSPAELDRAVAFGPAGGREFTVRQLAPVAAGHCRGHLADARAALESRSG